MMMRFCLAVGLLLALTATQVVAITADSLRQQLDDADRPVVIDVRNDNEFAAGHIAGSLRIPLVGIESRRIPPFGDVVIVWNGVDRDTAERAMAAFGKAEGVSPELLQGGYPAWSGATVQSGVTRGLRAAEVNYINLAQFEKLATETNVVVLDLRDPSATGELADVRSVLPGALVITPPQRQREDMRMQERRDVRQNKLPTAVPRWLRNRSLPEDAIYVLIDSGDGARSERLARRMQAREQRAVYVLMGGETALSNGKEMQQRTRTLGGAGDE